MGIHPPNLSSQYIENGSIPDYANTKRGRSDHDLVVEDFTLFYFSKLQRRIGAKVSCSLLLDAYLDWAGANGRGSINSRELRRLMAGFRHRHIKADRMMYLDVEFACDPRPATVRPEARREPCEKPARSVARQIDVLIQGFEQLKLALGDG